MENEVLLIGCRSCDSKNCGGCNLLTLEEMLHKGTLDCLMDESRSIVATPESLRPKGRWEKHWCETDLIGHMYEVCTNCRSCEILDTDKFWDSNYCPNCGAGMEG